MFLPTFSDFNDTLYCSVLYAAHVDIPPISVSVLHHLPSWMMNFALIPQSHIQAQGIAHGELSL